MKKNNIKISELLWSILALFIFYGFILYMIFLFIGFIAVIIESSPVYEYHYIDLDGNQGVAEFCHRDSMKCEIENKRILVKEYKYVCVKNCENSFYDKN